MQKATYSQALFRLWFPVIAFFHCTLFHPQSWASSEQAVPRPARPSSHPAGARAPGPLKLGYFTRIRTSAGVINFYCAAYNIFCGEIDNQFSTGDPGYYNHIYICRIFLLTISVAAQSFWPRQYNVRNLWCNNSLRTTLRAKTRSIICVVPILK